MVRCILSNVGYHEHGSDKNNFTCRRARKRQKKVHNHNVRCGERQLSKNNNNKIEYVSTAYRHFP